MRLFLSEDGKAGFALKPDGDIVSVFSADRSGYGRAVMELAVSAGGKKLDAFATILPDFYSLSGFRPAARIAWDDSQAPDGWSKQAFSRFNGGEPDVVFMVYDPIYMGTRYDEKRTPLLKDYGRAVNRQAKEVKQISSRPPAGSTYSQTPYFMSRFEQLLMEMAEIEQRAKETEAVAPSDDILRDNYGYAADLYVTSGAPHKFSSTPFEGGRRVNLRLSNPLSVNLAGEVKDKDGHVYSRSELVGLFGNDLASRIQYPAKFTADDVALLKENGYDGVVSKSQDGLIYAAAADPSLAFDPDAALGVKVKPLIVAHNTTIDKLAQSIKLYGNVLPVPSIAVTPADEPLVRFGDITFVGGPSVIDPQADPRNKVYGSDIYSPRHPAVEEGVSYDELKDGYEDLIKRYDVPQELINHPSNPSLENIFQADSAYYAAQQLETRLDVAYAATVAITGETPKDYLVRKIPQAPIPLEFEGFLGKELIDEFVATVEADAEKEGFAPEDAVYVVTQDTDDTFRKNNPELIGRIGQAIGRWIDVMIDREISSPGGEELGPEFVFQFLVNGDAFVREKKPRADGAYTPTDFALRLIYKNAKYDANAQAGIDYYETLKKLTAWEDGAVVPGSISAFLMERVVRPAIVPTYTDGKPVTPEETVRRMTKEGIRNREVKQDIITEMVNLRAAVTPEFQTVESIALWRNRLKSDADWSNTKGEYADRLRNVRETLTNLARKYTTSRFNAVNLLARYAETHPDKDPDAFSRLMAEEMGDMAYPVPPEEMRAAQTEADEFLAELATMPTEYLEAKPERLVRFDEFGAVVAQVGTISENMKTILKSQGLKVVEYKKFGDRRAAIKAAAQEGGYLFQSAGNGARGQIFLPTGGLANGEAVISIFENADLSTFLHEAGHWHLALLKAVAEDPSTPAGSGVADDWATLRAWWRENAEAVAKDALRVDAESGVTAEDVIRAIDTGTSGDARKDAAIDVGMHEQFARGFEAYLMEGKAPSAELSGPFAAFRSWLVAIYNSIKNLGVQLTPEVKAVMDRMLATQEQIQQAEKAAGGEMLFRSAAEMGVDEASYRELVKMHESARSEAERRLLLKFLRPILAQRKAEWKAERAEVRASVEREINARPVYRVIEWLGNRRWLGDDQPEQLPFLTMSRQQLIDGWGEEILDQLPRGFHRLFSANADTAMHPDEVAGWFGYETGDDMIKDLISARPRRELIDATTDEIMTKRHGDPLKDGSAEREAQEAYHADTRARFLQAEMEALFKRMGPKGTPSTLAVTREIARRAIAMMPVRRAMVTGAFLKAERQAAFDAQKALAGGDIEAAAKAKRMQLLNNLMWVEARKAAAEVERIERLAKRLAKKSVRENLAGSYLEAIDQLLEQYDFRKTSARSDQRRDALARYIAEMTAAGRANELSIPEALIAETQRRPYKTLTVEELRGVGDALRNIEHMARLKQKLLDAKAERELDAVVEDIGQAFNDNIKAKPPARGQPTTGERWRTGLQRYLNLFLATDTILNEIDGFVTGGLGKVYQHIKGPIDAAQALLVNRRHKAAQDIEQLFSVYSRKERQQMGIARRHDQLNGAFSKWELISMALNMGNEGGMERLTNKKTADYLSPAQIEYVKSQLDQRDWQFVQNTWDYINSFWPEIEARERRVTGVSPKKVPPLPVDTPFGQLRGGYYPIVYDSRLNSRADALEVNEVADQMKSGAFGKAATWNGFTKERTAETRMRLRYDVGVISKHVNGVLHDLALSEPVAAASRILSDQRVRSLFVDFGRGDDLKTLDTWLLDVASGDVVQGDMLNGAARRIKGTFTVGKLLYSIPTAILQATGVFQAAVVVGKVNFVRGLTTYLKDPMIYRSIVQRSDFMRERMTTFNKDLVDLRNDLTKNGPLAGRYDRFMSEVFIPGGFWMMIRAQFHFVDVPTWIAAYQSGTRDGMSEEAAAAYADRMVARAATSGLQTDRSAIERGSIGIKNRQQDIVRLFTALGSYMFAKMNVAYSRARGTNYRSPGEVMNLATDLVLLFTVEGLLAALVRGGLPGDDDDDDSVADDWAWTIARETGLAVTGGLPGIRDMASVVQGFSGGGAYGGFMDMVGRAFGEAYELGEELTVDGEVDFTRSDAKAWINAMSLFVTLPTSQLNRTVVDPLFDMMEGEDVSPVEMLLGKPPQSKQ